MGDGFCCGCCVGAALIYVLLPEKKCKIEVKHTSASIESKLAMDSNSCQGTEPEKSFLVAQIEHYQSDISPRLHELTGAERICKFEPSCSEYAKQSIEKYGNVKGSLRAAARLVRCNPVTKGGYDPA